MTRRTLLALLLVAVIAGCAQPEAPTGQVPQELPEPPAEAPVEELPEPAAPVEADLEGEPDVTFQLTGENFRFNIGDQVNPELRVQRGDHVRIEFESTSGFHDWVLDEFGARTQQVRPGTPTFVEFIADEAGTFEYYCSVGSHRQNGMRGAFVVE